MGALFAGGRIVDLIIVLMVCEAALLALLHARSGTGVAPRRLLPNLFAGAFLLLALRAALTGAGYVFIGLWLTLGLVAHLSDLATRWKRTPTGSPVRPSA